jgi:cytochrome c oxidase subunit 2
VTPELITTNMAVDPIFMGLFAVCLLLLVGITVVMLWFVFRYHRSRAPEPTSGADGNIWLEIVWIVIPVVLVLAMFYYGWAGYLALRKVPHGALEVTATARMWSWNFTYAGGRTSSKLYVPVGKPVLVDLVSNDVIHGFYLPAFRVKRDIVPGMKNQVWFVAERPGTYDLFCSQYCGQGHSAMITTVVALPRAEFEVWLQGETGRETAQESPGHELLEKHGCVGCHSLDGSAKVGPSFKGIWGRSVTVTSGGVTRTVTVDDAYLRRSILDPGADLVKGFPPVMPAYKDLGNEELNAMIEYMKGVR